MIEMLLQVNRQPIPLNPCVDKHLPCNSQEWKSRQVILLISDAWFNLCLQVTWQICCSQKKTWWRH